MRCIFMRFGKAFIMISAVFAVLVLVTPTFVFPIVAWRYWPLEWGTWTEIWAILVAYIGIIVTGIFSWLLYRVSKKAAEVTERSAKLSEYTSRVLAIAEKRNMTEKLKADELVRKTVMVQLEHEMSRVKTFVALLQLSVKKYLDQFMDVLDEVRGLRKEMSEELELVKDEVQELRKQKLLSVNSLRIMSDYFENSKAVLNRIPALESPRVKYKDDFSYNQFKVSLDRIKHGVSFTEEQLNRIEEIEQARNALFAEELVLFENGAIGLKPPEFQNFTQLFFEQKWEMANALLEQYTESYEDDLRRIKSRVDEIEARIQELKKSLSDYNHSMYSDLTIFDDVIRFRVDASEK